MWVTSHVHVPSMVASCTLAETIGGPPKHLFSTSSLIKGSHVEPGTLLSLLQWCVGLWLSVSQWDVSRGICGTSEKSPWKELTHLEGPLFVLLPFLLLACNTDVMSRTPKPSETLGWPWGWKSLARIVKQKDGNFCFAEHGMHWARAEFLGITGF